jgi:RNA polymerase sigma-70 factor (ECF subfamily)
VLRGNASAFRGIVQRYKGLLFRLARSYLNDPEEAEDACQDIFLKAFRSLGSFSIDRRFLPWLYSIASNHLRTRVGRVKRLHEKTVHPPVEVIPADKSADPRESFIRQESLRDIRAAVAALPPPVRDVVHLYYFEGMNVEQVSSALGVGKENVKSRLLRGRKRIKEILSGPATEDGAAEYSGRGDSGEGDSP